MQNQDDAGHALEKKAADVKGKVIRKESTQLLKIIDEERRSMETVIPEPEAQGAGPDNANKNENFDVQQLNNYNRQQAVPEQSTSQAPSNNVDLEDVTKENKDVDSLNNTLYLHSGKASDEASPSGPYTRLQQNTNTGFPNAQLHVRQDFSTPLTFYEQHIKNKPGGTTRKKRPSNKLDTISSQSSMQSKALSKLQNSN